MVDRRTVALALGEERTLLLWFDRPLGYLMEGCLDSLMADPHAPVNQFFNHDPLCPDPVLYLIELAAKLDGMIIFEGPFRLYAENGVEVNVGRTMQVLFLLRLYRKAFVINRQIGDEELVCLVYRSTPLSCISLTTRSWNVLNRRLFFPWPGESGHELSDPQLLQSPPDIKFNE